MPHGRALLALLAHGASTRLGGASSRATFLQTSIFNRFVSQSMENTSLLYIRKGLWKKHWGQVSHACCTGSETFPIDHHFGKHSNITILYTLVGTAQVPITDRKIAISDDLRHKWVDYFEDQPMHVPEVR